VTREQVAHVLRTVARISGERDILIIGSQSVLGSYPEDALPARATGSSAGVISLDILAERAGPLPAHPAVIDRIQNRINAIRSR
jgi:hypothetical protein